MQSYHRVEDFFEVSSLGPCSFKTRKRFLQRLQVIFHFTNDFITINPSFFQSVKEQVCAFVNNVPCKKVYTVNKVICCFLRQFIVLFKCQ